MGKYHTVRVLVSPNQEEKIKRAVNAKVASYVTFRLPTDADVAHSHLLRLSNRQLSKIQGSAPHRTFTFRFSRDQLQHNASYSGGFVRKYRRIF